MSDPSFPQSSPPPGPPLNSAPTVPDSTTPFSFQPPFSPTGPSSSRDSATLPGGLPLSTVPVSIQGGVSPTPPAGAIAGGVIGGLVLLFGLLTAFFIIRRKIRDRKGGAYTQTRSGPSDRGLGGVNMVGPPRFPRREPTDNSSMQEGLLGDAERGIQRPKYWLSGSESRQSVYAGEEFDPDTLIMDAAHHDPRLYTHEGSPSGSTSTISFDTVRGDESMPTPTQAHPQSVAVAVSPPPAQEREDSIYLGEQLTSAFKRPILGSVSSSLTASSYNSDTTDDWASDGSRSWVPVGTPSPGSENKGFRLDGYNPSRQSGVTLRDVRGSGSGQMSVEIQQSSLLGSSDQGYVHLEADEDGLT